MLSSSVYFLAFNALSLQLHPIIYNIILYYKNTKYKYILKKKSGLFNSVRLTNTWNFNGNFYYEWSNV
jgi:hypothetical protein